MKGDILPCQGIDHPIHGIKAAMNIRRKKGANRPLLLFKETVMTKKSANKEHQPTTQLFVYGEDEAGKPKGARFPATERDRLIPVVETMKLRIFEAGSEELIAVGMKLPVGRIYARGKSFIPNIRRELYDTI